MSSDDELAAANAVAEAPRKLTKEILRQLPKAELHCHLDGSVRIETVIDLAKEQRVELPTMDAGELRKLISVDLHCESLSEYLRGFSITLSVLQKQYAITRAMYEVAEDAANDGVRYLEVRFSPVLHTQEGLSLSSVMEAICEGRMMAELKLPISVRIIVCGMRHLDPEVTKNIGEIAWRYRPQGVVAFDLAGPETGFSSKEHKDAFDIVRRRHLNCTLHSGEESQAGWESINDSVRFCGAHRIGHGVMLAKNKELMSFLADRGIAIECCLTSNVQTKAIKTLDDHPVRTFIDAGVCVVPCTDNVTVSGVQLSEEYWEFYTRYDLSIPEMVRLIDNGFASAFANHYVRRRVRAEAFQSVIKILWKHGFDVKPVLDHFKYDIPLGEVAVPRPVTPGPYWEDWDNPDISLDHCKNIPKADLHCRLAGSLSLDFVWNELQKMTKEERSMICRRADSSSEKICLDTFDDLRLLVQSPQHTRESRFAAHTVMEAAIQTEDQIRRGILDVFTDAVSDGVTYLELMVRPRSHTIGALTARQVAEIVVSEVEETAKLPQLKGLDVGIVFYNLHPEDDPIVARGVAELALEFRSRGVVGVGFYGRDITDTAMPFYESTFHLLKNNHMNVCMTGGTSDASQAMHAVAVGGAVRISRAFRAHDHPSLANYLASHHIPVELGATDVLETLTKSVRSFAGHPVRLFMDQEISCSICSFDRTFYPTTRSEALYKIATACNMNIAEFLKLLSTGFQRNCQGATECRRLFAKFWDEATEQLAEAGFAHFKKKWFGVGF